MRRFFQILLAVAAIILVFLVDWPERQRQLSRLAQRLRAALPESQDDGEAVPAPAPVLPLHPTTNGATAAKLLTLPRLWLASAVVIILAAIALRPLLP